MTLQSIRARRIEQGRSFRLIKIPTDMIRCNISWRFFPDGAGFVYSLLPIWVRPPTHGWTSGRIDDLAVAPESCSKAVRPQELMFVSGRARGRFLTRPGTALLQALGHAVGSLHLLDAYMIWLSQPPICPGGRARFFSAPLALGLIGISSR
jgi:hypothetical protein